MWLPPAHFFAPSAAHRTHISKKTTFARRHHGDASSSIRHSPQAATASTAPPPAARTTAVTVSGRDSSQQPQLAVCVCVCVWLQRNARASTGREARTLKSLYYPVLVLLLLLC